jgi:hypothetical protein
MHWGPANLRWSIQNLLVNATPDIIGIVHEQRAKAVASAQDFRRVLFAIGNDPDEKKLLAR